MDKMLKQNFKNIFQLIKSNKLLFAISSLIDLGFIAVFMIAFWEIVYKKIFSALMGISDVMRGMQGISPDMESQADAYTSLAGSIEFLGLYAGLIRWLAIFVIVVFLLWLVFGGLGFFAVGKIVDKKIKFWNYIGKFSLFSLFFYILVVFSFWVTIYLSMLNSKMIVPVFTQGVINVVLVILLVVIHYFCLVSLVMIRKRKIVSAFLDTFRLGVKKVKNMLLVFVLAGVILAFSFGITYLFFRINIFLSYFGILLILIPSISFARIMFFYMVERIE